MSGLVWVSGTNDGAFVRLYGQLSVHFRFIIVARAWQTGVLAPPRFCRR